MMAPKRKWGRSRRQSRVQESLMTSWPGAQALQFNVRRYANNAFGLNALYSNNSSGAGSANVNNAFGDEGPLQ